MESPLKSATRCLSIIPGEDGFIIGSIAGKISVEYSENKDKMLNRSYSFKCHRQETLKESVIYPVNSIVFHP